MATYIPNATQTTEPVESRTVESAALEFRTLKTSINARIEDVQDGLDTEIVNRLAGDATLQTKNNAQDVRLQAIEAALLVIGEGGLPGTVYVQRLSGTGAQTSFTLNVSVPSSALIDVFINGIYQNKNTFTIVDDVLTFSEAPPAGTDNVEVVVSITIANVETDASLVSFRATDSTVVVRTAQDKMREVVSVFDFMTAGEIASVQARDLAADVTAAVQAGMNRAIAIGAVLFFPAGSYKITDTISLTNANHSYSGGMQGENGNSTRIHFFNGTSLKNMFYVDSDVNYLTVSDLEFSDNTARTSRAFYFSDTLANTAPSWKHMFKNVRVVQFKEGVRFDGGATIGDDAHESEVMFLHSKCRNCETGLIYNNIQAVNHQLIGMDFENDAEGVSDEWTHIKMERGTSVNHLGGSVIGKGSYLKYKYAIAGGFQNTSQFASKGVRVEKRGGAAPIINHDTDSIITVSNSLRIIIDDMPVVASGGATVFARFGGRSFAKFQNVHANVQMDVEAYITTNLGGNSEYGSIVLESCKALNYKRISTVTAYGSAGVAATNYRSIPADISKSGEGVVGQNDGAGYFTLNNPHQTIYQGGWITSHIKTLVYAPGDSGGFGSGVNPATALINLPLYGRPCKFRLLRDDINAGLAFQLDLIVVVAGVDYTVATITPTANVGGHFETDIQTLTGLTTFLNDGVNWDGKMKVVKSGTTNGFVGLIMIDYM